MNALIALNRARRAWERTQPQLFFELWPDGLEDPSLTADDPVQEAVTRTGRIFEPALPEGLPRGGLDPTSRGAGASLPEESRAHPQKGA